MIIRSSPNQPRSMTPTRKFDESRQAYSHQAGVESALSLKRRSLPNHRTSASGMRVYCLLLTWRRIITISNGVSRHASMTACVPCRRLGSCREDVNVAGLWRVNGKSRPIVYSSKRYRQAPVDRYAFSFYQVAERCWPPTVWRNARGARRRRLHQGEIFIKCSKPTKAIMHFII